MGQRILASNVADDRQVAERQAVPLSWAWRDRIGLVSTVVVLLGASTVFVVLASMYVPEAVRVAGMLVGTGGVTGQLEITSCTLQKGAESNEYWRCVGNFISDSGRPDGDGVAGRS